MPLQLLIEHPADAAATPNADDDHRSPRTRTTRFRVIECTSDTSTTRSNCSVGGPGSSWILIARVLLAHAVALYCFQTFAHFSSLRTLLSFPSLLWPHLPCLLALLLAGRLVGWRSQRGNDALQQLREESILVIPGVGVQLESGTASFDPSAARAAVDATRDGDSRSASAVRSTLAAASSSSFPSLDRLSRRFLDASSIAHVLINEGVHRSTFGYYLVIVLKSATTATTRQTGEARVKGSEDASAGSSSIAASAAASAAGLAAPSDLIHADQTLVLPFESLQPRYNILLPIYEGMQACLEATTAAR